MSATKIIAPHRYRLPPLPTIRDLVRLYKLRAIRQLSQNFLMDERLTDKIVQAAGSLRGQYVCEVGPGPGGITRSIIRRMPKKLVVIEKDPRFLPTLELLKDSCADQTHMQIDIDDVLLYNLEAPFKGVLPCDWFEAPPPIHLIGNLPFNVSTILIVRWLKLISEKTSAWSYGRTAMTLTFQQEVAERLVAPPKDKQRCRLSVMCQMWTQPKLQFTIPGKAFVPKPDVDVGVVTLKPLKYPISEKLPFHCVEKVLRNIFNMRQKYSIRGAERLFPEPLRDKLSMRLFELADVDYMARPFEITNKEYARICHAFKLFCQDYPELEHYDSRAPAEILSSNQFNAAV